MARGPKDPTPSRPTEVVRAHPADVVKARPTEVVKARPTEVVEEGPRRPTGPDTEAETGAGRPAAASPFGRDPIDLDLAVRPPRVAPAPGNAPADPPGPGDEPPVLAGIPDGAVVYPNRSGEEGSGYEEMVGPDLVFHDGVWYAVHERTGELHPVHVGPHLAPTEQVFPLGDAIYFEATSGTGLWNTGVVQEQGLRIDGATGDLVTAGGRRFDPDAVAVVRAADGTYLVHDTEAGTCGPLSNLDQTYTAADLPPGPYTTTGGGPGYPPPLTDLAPGTELVYDPEHLRYEDPGTGAIVGFHESQLDDLRTWENRSGDPDSPYQDMQGPDVHYLDGIWYAEQEDGTYVPFHEGRYLDLSAQHFPLGDALRYESTANTPIFGEHPSTYGLVLDGETGGFVDAAGMPVDWDTFDPAAATADPPVVDPDFGAGASADEAGGWSAADEPDLADGDDGGGLGEGTDGLGVGGDEAGAASPVGVDQGEAVAHHLPGPGDSLFAEPVLPGDHDDLGDPEP